MKKRNGEQKLVPVELKTGKSKLNTEHVTQVMLYSLALASKQVNTTSKYLIFERHGFCSHVTQVPLLNCIVEQILNNASVS